MPSPLTVDAIGPAGTAVSDTATATDGLDPDPAVLCTPSSGGLFAIGVTAVACHAIDTGGNTSNARLSITVLGAKAQLSNLIREVVDSPRLPNVILRGGLLRATSTATDNRVDGHIICNGGAPRGPAGLGAIGSGARPTGDGCEGDVDGTIGGRYLGC